MGFIVGVSVICIVLAQIAPEDGFREWLGGLRHKDLIDKGIEIKAPETVKEPQGTMLTYYRHGRFDATDPTQLDPDAPMIALTFDDGPNPEYTKKILDVLQENYSHATFFVLGNNAESYPDVLKTISDQGSEIGNHTYSHKKLSTLSTEDVTNEIQKVNQAVVNATGNEATLIRPPYGDYNDAVMSVLDKPVVLWDLDTEDWKSRNAQTIAQAVLDHVKDGDIVLMHDIYESTAEAVALMVPQLKEKGYQIVTIHEMAQLRGKQLELGKAYGEIDAASGQ